MKVEDIECEILGPDAEHGSSPAHQLISLFIFLLVGAVERLFGQ